MYIYIYIYIPHQPLTLRDIKSVMKSCMNLHIIETITNCNKNAYPAMEKRAHTNPLLIVQKV